MLRKRGRPSQGNDVQITVRISSKDMKMIRRRAKVLKYPVATVVRKLISNGLVLAI